MPISQVSEQFKWKSLTQGHTLLIKGRTRGKCCCLSVALRCVCHSLENAFPLRSAMVVHVKYTSTQQKMSLTSELLPLLKSSTVTALRETSR